MEELERCVALVNSQGLHARPISSIIATARRHQAELMVGCEDRWAHGNSVLELMTLGAGPSAVLRLRARGVDADALLNDLERLIQGGFGEK